MWEAINNFLVAVDDKVWGVPLMVLIIAGGVLLTSTTWAASGTPPSTGTEMDV